MIKINKCMPNKLADVIDCRDIPVDYKNDSYKIRVLQLMRKLFGINNCKDKEHIKEYNASEELLWKTIQNPNNILGIVCIDGYSRENDKSYKNDIGIVLNMGIPKLRARRFHVLDRIYAHIHIDGSTTKVNFYNSPYDNGGEQQFSFTNKVPGWHPHITNSNACLGSYANRLQRFYAMKNALMYIKTLNQFLLTWNIRSPFWYLESGPAIRESYDDKETLPASKYLNVMNLNYGDTEVNEFKSFCQKYYNTIDNKENITTYDKINYLSIVFNICKRNLNHVIELSTDNNKVPQIEELRQIYSEFEAYSGSNHTGSIIDTSRPILRFNTLRKLVDTYPIRMKQSMKYTMSDIIDGKEKMNEIRLVKKVIHNMCRMAIKIYDNCTSSTIHNEIIFNDIHVHKVMHLVNNYLIPLRVSIQNECDELVLSKKVLTRPSFRKLSFYHSGRATELESFKNKYNLRVTRLLKITNKIAEKGVDNEFIVKYINKEIETSFLYNIIEEEYEVYSGDIQSYITKKRNVIEYGECGTFWHWFHGSVIEPETEMSLKLLGSNLPTNYDEYIRNYNNIVNTLYELETNVVIQMLNKAKKELINGLQISNTEKRTQQVPLFFD